MVLAQSLITEEEKGKGRDATCFTATQDFFLPMASAFRPAAQVSRRGEMPASCCSGNLNKL